MSVFNFESSERNAVALYDFKGDPNSEELTFNAGDIVTIINTQSDDGWWEGRLSDGTLGIFPELYVQLLTKSHSNTPDVDRMAEKSSSSPVNGSPPQERPPTPPPLPFSLPKPPKTAPPKIKDIEPVKSEGSGLLISVEPLTLSRDKAQTIAALPMSPPYTPDDSDKDETPDRSGGLFIPRIISHSFSVASSSQPAVTCGEESVADNGSYTEQEILQESEDNNGLLQSKRPTIRRKFNRFSKFVSTGAEEFLLSQEDLNAVKQKISVEGPLGGSQHVPEDELEDQPGLDKPHHLTGADDSRWVDDGLTAFDISITGNLVKTKYAGTKRYVAYQIFDAVSNTIVYRRYKHFDWMHAVLQKKYPSLCLPPLPNRQVQGRFEQEFIESRQHALERYLRRVSSHPVLRKSEVFSLFITCSESDKWKPGKRKCEKDAAKGEKFLNTIHIPQEFNDEPVQETEIATSLKFSKFTKSMTVNCLALWDAINGITLAAPAMEHLYLRLAFSMKRLVRGDPRTDKGVNTNTEGDWCWKENCENCAKLTSSIDQTFSAIRDMAVFWETNSSKSCAPILEKLKDYEQLIESMDLAVDLFNTTANKANIANKNSASTDQRQLSQFNDRCALLLGVTKAEINHFHDMRVHDFRKMFQNYISSQITFHEKMLEKLQIAQSGFE